MNCERLEATVKSWLLNSFVHFFYDALRLVGLRDRLRCPKCGAVGTWKPHGGAFDRDDRRKVRRWMCKWCGHYLGPDSPYGDVGYSEVAGCWISPLMSCTQEQAVTDTPQRVLLDSKIPHCWPWRG
jgi:hypothetical protein